MPLKVSLILIVFIVGLLVSQADAKQFDDWYPLYNKTLHDSAGKECYPNYIQREWPESKSHPRDTTDSANCANMASCLLKNLDDFDKADMQSAGVLLGLMPTFLQYISPNLGELDFIARRRPLLAFLMVIGAPAISVTRLFEFPRKGKSLKPDTIFVHKKVPRKAAIIFLQYWVVAVSTAASLSLSISVGRMTILSWKCTISLMQLWWNLLTIIPFILRASALWCSKTFQMGEPNRKFSNFLSRWLHSEFIPSAHHIKFPGYDKINPEAELDSGVAPWRRRLAFVFNWAADICVYVRWVFGTLLFSSTLFVGTVDALLKIVGPYLLAALSCRLVLLLELLEFEDRKEGTEEAEITDDRGCFVMDDMVPLRTT